MQDFEISFSPEVCKPVITRHQLLAIYLGKNQHCNERLTMADPKDSISVAALVPADPGLKICCSVSHWHGMQSHRGPAKRWLIEVAMLFDWCDHDDGDQMCIFFGTNHSRSSGWWFGTFCIFPHIGNNHPNWLIFFRGVETTNQT